MKKSKKVLAMAAALGLMVSLGNQISWQQEVDSGPLHYIVVKVPDLLLSSSQYIEVQADADIEPVSKFSEEEIDLLVKLVNGEAGSSWLSDEHQILVAIVVLNRVESEYFPNSVKEVIYQKGQYSCVGGRQWRTEPEDRVRENVLKAISQFENGDYPLGMVFQAEFTQGSKVYKKILNTHTGSYTYFCLL